MEDIYTANKYGKTYVLSREALKIYYKMTDSYADYINSKYGSEDEDDKENSFTDSQPNNTLVTSKDTQHILRLAAILHILHERVNRVLRPNDEEDSVEIPTIRLQQASTLYFTLQQHKDTFMQASMETVKNTLKLKPVKTFQDSVVRAICIFPGPLILQRSIQRHIKGALAENIRHEMDHMERNGFGSLKVINQRPYFMKLPAQCVDEEVGPHIQIMRSSGITLHDYDRALHNTTKLGEEEKAICRLMDLNII